jgi:hypothetical protein
MRRGVGRRGPGVVGVMARTAVVAGTATAVSGRVARRQQGKLQEEQAAQQGQDQLEDVQSQLNELQAQQAQAAVAGTPAPATAGSDIVAQLNQLSSLKAAGVLNDQEFEAAKAKLLGS